MQQEELLRNELLAEVESIAPILAEHAPLSEKLGRLDDATFEAIRSTRLLRCVCPRELVGLEAGPVTGMEIYEGVARIDGSAGWVLGILAGSSAIVASLLPAASARGSAPMASLRWPVRSRPQGRQNRSPAAIKSSRARRSAAGFIMPSGSSPQ